ncbi:uncharacterized protein LOC135687631 [Rhopilema esculentum]|uniref:uncharacterized protein LOC135687631 n=1 Tax=Rhopilema esculentum TaxID=499914 RepID=UPI0031D578E1
MLYLYLLFVIFSQQTKSSSLSSCLVLCAFDNKMAIKLPQLLECFVLILFINRIQTVTLEDVQKMKDDLSKELKSMEKTVAAKKSVYKDNQYEVVLSDLIQHDLQESLKHFTKDAGPEETAMKMIRKLIDEEKSGYVDADDKILDRLIAKEKEEKQQGKG